MYKTLPSAVLPSLPNIGRRSTKASVKIDSEINGSANSLNPSATPSTKPFNNISSSSIPSLTLFIKV